MPSKIARRPRSAKKKKSYGVMKKIKKYGPGVAAAALAVGTTAAGAYSSYSSLNPEKPPNPMGKKGADWEREEIDFDDLDAPPGMEDRVREALDDVAAREDAQDAETQAEISSELYKEFPKYTPPPDPSTYNRPSPQLPGGIPTVRAWSDWKKDNKIRQSDFY